MDFSPHHRAIHLASILVLAGIWVFLLAMGRIRYLRSRRGGDTGPWPFALLAFAVLAPLLAAGFVLRPYPSDVLADAVLLAAAALYTFLLFAGQCHACGRTYWTFREERVRCPHCNRELW